MQTPRGPSTRRTAYGAMHTPLLLSLALLLMVGSAKIKLSAPFGLMRRQAPKLDRDHRDAMVLR